MNTPRFVLPRPSDDDYELMTLRAVEGSGTRSQRELAAAMGVSLGKSNFLIRAVLERGWVKVQSFRSSDRKRRYFYYLTPSGATEKARRTLDFLRRKETEYYELRVQIEALRKEVGEIGGSDETEN